MEQAAGIEELRIIELGTGSGNIAVLIAMKTKNTEIYASDISEEAVGVAAVSVERCGIKDKVTLFSGDMFEPFRGKGLEGKTDLVVCNPLFVPPTSVDRLDSEIINYEPRVGLDAGACGLDIFQRLIKGAPEFLRPGGMLAFEIGAGQEKLIARLFKKTGDSYLAAVELENDGEIRVITAQRR